MANINATIRAKIVTPELPTIYNVEVTSANTEFFQVLNDSTKRFTIKARESAKLQLAYSFGDSGTTFVTIPRGAVYSEDNMSFSGTLYFQSDRAGVTVEIIEWV